MTTFNLVLLWVLLISSASALAISLIGIAIEGFSKRKTGMPSCTEFREKHTSEFDVSEYTDDDSIHLSHKRKDGTLVSTFITLGDLRKILKHEKTGSN